MSATTARAAPSRDAAAIARAKRRVALTSVVAGVGLTSLKAAIGLATGSLGLLAEAAHSGLDLVAALATLLAVQLADRPPDASHAYGHGKIENLSAFFEAGLLLLTAAWIAYEALARLLVRAVHVETSVWAFLVMIVSILVDVGRSRALRRAARAYHSPALEADGLHFGTDIWSSAVVLGGLAAVRIGDLTGWPGPWEQADALGALGVCGVVVFVGGRMVKETIDGLLDRAPEEMATRIVAALHAVPGVVATGTPRLRRVGNKVFADMVVQIARTRTFSQAHETTEAAERAARAVFPDADVDLVLHMEPAMAPDEGIDDTIRYRARESGLRVHNVRVTQTAAGGVEADVHVEADPALTLEQTYALAKDLEGAVRRDMPDLHAFNAHLEVLNPSIERRVEVTATHPTLVARVRAIADGIAGPGASHTLHVYRPTDEGGQPRMGGSDQGDPAAYDLVLHVAVPGDQPLPAVHEQAEEIERALRAAFPALAHVLIETEPAA